MDLDKRKNTENPCSSSEISKFQPTNKNSNCYHGKSTEQVLFEEFEKAFGLENGKTEKEIPKEDEVKEKNGNYQQLYDIFVVHRGSNKWDFINYNLDTGEYLPYEQKIEICKNYFLNEIIPNLIKKKIISQDQVPIYKDLRTGGYGTFLNVISNGIYKLRFNDLLINSNFDVNKDSERFRFLNYDSEGLELSKEQQIAAIGSYFNDIIIPNLIKKKIINSVEDFKYNQDKDFLSFISACNRKGFKLGDIIQTSNLNIIYKKDLIKKLFSFLDSRINLIKDFSFLPTPENIINLEPSFNNIVNLDDQISKWISQNFLFSNLKGLNDYKKFFDIYNFKKQFFHHLNILLNAFSDSKFLENDVKTMFKDLLDSFSNSNNELEKIEKYYNMTYKFSDPKYLALVLFHLHYKDIKFIKKIVPVDFNNIINSSNYTKVKYIVFNQLRANEKYHFIFKFCQLEWLSSSEYFIVLKDYLKLSQKIFPLINIDFILNYLEKNSEVFNDRFSVNNFSAVMALIYLRYFCNELIEAKSFVDNLNTDKNFHLNYNSFSRYFNILSKKFFELQHHNYKNQGSIIKSLYHYGRVYLYQIFADRFNSNNPLHNILLDYLKYVLDKKNLPFKFFDVNFKDIASNFFLKGSFHEILNYEEDLEHFFKQLKIYKNDFYLCQTTQSVYDYFFNSNFGNPDHQAIYDEIIETYNDIVASEIPVWLSDRNNECFYTGHIDLIKLSDSTIYILDYKRNDYELIRSLPQIALYGLMLIDRLKFFNKEINLDIICICFSKDNAFEFSPNIFKKELPELIRSINFKRNDPLRTKDSRKDLLEEILKIIDVLPSESFI